MPEASESRDRTYLIHTGRELELMLAGKKPLAHFTDVHPEDPCEEIIPIATFEPYLQSGRFLTRQFVELLRTPPPENHAHLRGTLHVFYAPPAEEWRIDAYIQMLVDSAETGWSEEFERLEGALLGYNQTQCDENMAALRSNPVTASWYWLRSGGG